MKPVLYYLLQVICTSAILYGYYHVALRNKRFHHYNRFYLLASTLVSMLIPFLDIPVYFTRQETDTSFVLQTLTVISSAGTEESADRFVAAQESPWFTWQNLLYLLYATIGFIILCRILFSLARIRSIIRSNPVEKLEHIRFVNTSEPNTPFSFFRWLFWNKQIDLQSSKGQQIFRHELFHIGQKHSYDIIFLEIVTLIFWINPFFHLVKKETKAIHEFLADQFAIREHNGWEYAELLLMQALQTQHHLVHPFFHNQIKRRIAMITTSQKPGHQYLRKMMVLPLAAVIVALFAFNYKNKSDHSYSSPAEKPITVVIDAGHGGTDIGARGPDGTQEKDLVLAIAQKVKALNSDENIKIILTRDADEFPSLASRSQAAIQQKADLFLSLHINAEAEKAKVKSGMEVVISQKNKTHEPENKILASILLNYFSQIYSTKMETVKSRSGIYVLDNSPCPAALVEIGYMTNENDLAYIKDPGNQEKIATVILNTIDQYATQRKSADWNERKLVFSDTTNPEVKVMSNTSTGEKYLAVDNKKITGIIRAKEGHLGLVFENGLIVLSKEQSKQVQSQYGEWLKKLKEENGEVVINNDKSDKGEKGDKGDKGDKGEKGDKGDKGEKSDNIIFDRVEIEATYTGGADAWRKHLERNLDPSAVTKKKAPDGAYTVIVMFSVNKDGSVSDIKALTKHGFGMEEEAIRVVKLGAKWNPAIQNGKIVKSYKKQPVTFIIGKGDKNFRPTTDVSDGSMGEVVATAPASTESRTSKSPTISLAELKKSAAKDLIQLPPGAEIVSFIFTIDTDNGDLVEVPNQGSEWNARTKSLIDRSKAGKLFTLDNIRVKNEGREMKVPSRFYTIVD